MPLMCNNKVDSSEELTSEYDRHLNLAVFIAMDSNSTTATRTNLNLNLNLHSNSNGNEEIPRAKFLCSFGGCVLPRPQDGKLRYVGGETRIVSVPRNIRYEELMARMRELYEGASILKYQQPDEDLDALVSVVNDDDVTNMMEEYDKLGSSDGFTRLRIFLFSHLEQDASPRYMDGPDERDTEKRYVDALNSLCESPDYRRQNLGDSPLNAPFDEIHIADQFFNSMNLDGSAAHNQRSYEMGIPQYSLGQLGNPSIAASGQYEEPPWSPAVYNSPRYAGSRAYTEIAPPSPARVHIPYQEMTDKCIDSRMVEEPNHQQVNPQIPFEHRQQYSDQVVWLPTGPVPVERGGFPVNVLNGANVVDSPSACHHCKSNFPRKPGEQQGYVESSAMVNGFSKVASPCVECLPRAHMSGVGRMGDQFTLDGPTMKVPIGPGSVHGADLGGEVFHGPAIPNGSHVHVPLEEQGARTPNLHYTPGPDIPHQVSHGSTSVLASRRHPPAPLHLLPHDPSIVQPRNGIHPSGLVPTPRSVVDGSPRFLVGVDQSPWGVDSPRKRVGDGLPVPDSPYGHHAKLSHHTPFQEIHPPTFVQDPLRNASSVLRIPPMEALRPELPMAMANDSLLSSNARGHCQLQRQDTRNIEVAVECVATKSSHSREAGSSDIDDVSPPEQNGKADRSSANGSVDAHKSNSRNRAEGSEDNSLKGKNKSSSSTKNGEINSSREAKVEVTKEVKGGAQNKASEGVLHADGTESQDVKNNSEGGSENECDGEAKIETTTAEEEAIAKGLQTIRNADLEEIRELGSGTYGAVYHGKWKGSDVAIKRIKASCFAGRPSERERLIADFWKEALILSSLHHPNVVSFYGVVRDGPDGSLATVTEFMVNGSLKQYLRKKDRTIDRRKRLIIAMDAAFGMEYLHEKNIVHFDLKCENLLVNMRDPHRPVCKIGDLGLSKVNQHTLVSGGVRGTLPWMAPELLSGKSHMVTEKIDVYSFGIVMWELLTGEEPYSDIHCASLIGGIVNNTLRPQIPTWCDPGWKALMESCWASDPAERPSFSEISQKLRTMAAAMNVK